MKQRMRKQSLLWFREARGYQKCLAPFHLGKCHVFCQYATSVPPMFIIPAERFLGGIYIVLALSHVYQTLLTCTYPDIVDTVSSWVLVFKRYLSSFNQGNWVHKICLAFTWNNSYKLVLWCPAVSVNREGDCW